MHYQLRKETVKHSLLKGLKPWNFRLVTKANITQTKTRAIMSSNIKIERICQYYKNKFIAKTTTTKYCSHRCNQQHYKLLAKKENIRTSNIETSVTGKLQTTINFEHLATKELLTITEASALLNITHVTLRRWIKEKRIASSRIGKKHLIKREHLDYLIA